MYWVLTMTSNLAYMSTTFPEKQKQSEKITWRIFFQPNINKSGQLYNAPRVKVQKIAIKSTMTWVVGQWKLKSKLLLLVFNMPWNLFKTLKLFLPEPATTGKADTLCWTNSLRACMMGVCSVTVCMWSYEPILSSFRVRYINSGFGKRSICEKRVIIAVVLILVM